MSKSSLNQPNYKKGALNTHKHQPAICSNESYDDPSLRHDKDKTIENKLNLVFGLLRKSTARTNGIWKIIQALTNKIQLMEEMISKSVNTSQTIYENSSNSIDQTSCQEKDEIRKKRNSKKKDNKDQKERKNNNKNTKHGRRVNINKKNESGPRIPTDHNTNNKLQKNRDDKKIKNADSSYIAKKKGKKIIEISRTNFGVIEYSTEKKPKNNNYGEKKPTKNNNNINKNNLIFKKKLINNSFNVNNNHSNNSLLNSSININKKINNKCQYAETQDDHSKKSNNNTKRYNRQQSNQWKNRQYKDINDELRNDQSRFSNSNTRRYRYNKNIQQQHRYRQYNNRWKYNNQGKYRRHRDMKTCDYNQVNKDRRKNSNNKLNNKYRYTYRTK